MPGAPEGMVALIVGVEQEKIGPLTLSYEIEEADCFLAGAPFPFCLFWGLSRDFGPGVTGDNFPDCSLLGHDTISSSKALSSLTSFGFFFARLTFLSFWILLEIEKLSSPTLRRILHLTRCAIVCEEKLVMALDHPAVKEGCLRVFYVGNIVGKRFTEENVALDLVSALEFGKKIEPRKVMWSLGSCCCEYRRHEVEGGTEFRPIGGWDGSLPTEHDGVAGTAFVRDCAWSEDHSSPVSV